MDKQTMYDLTLKILKEAENVYDKDAVFAKMFEQGIPFTKITPLYNEVGKANDLLIDMPKLKLDAQEYLKTLNIAEFKDFDHLMEVAAATSKKLNGAPVEFILKAMRSYYKDQEVAIPRKAREYAPRGPRGSKVSEALINYCKEVGAKATRKGLYDAIRPHVKTPRNAYDQVNLMFVIVVGLVNQITYDEAFAKCKEMPVLNLDELNEAEEAKLKEAA